MKKFLIIFVFFVLFAITASAIDANVDPDGDSSPLEWSSTGASHYTEIDDGVRYDNTPTLSDSISVITDEVTDVFDMATLANAGSVSSITVWAYSFSQLGLYGNIYVDGSWQTEQQLTGDTSWASITFNGNWDQTDLDNLQVKLRNTGGGGSGVYAMYAEITYEEAIPEYPNAFFVAVALVAAIGLPLFLFKRKKQQTNN